MREALCDLTISGSIDCNMNNPSAMEDDLRAEYLISGVHVNGSSDGNRRALAQSYF